MTPIAHAMSAALVHFIWEGLAVAFLLWLTLTGLRRASAKLRYGVSCAAFAIMIVLPFITVWILYRAPGATIARSGQAVAVPAFTGSAAFSTVPWFSQWIAAFEAWALPVWSIGVMIFAVRLFWSCHQADRLRREGDSAQATLIGTVSRLAHRMKIARPLRVVLSKLTDAPGVVGWLRPTILVPAASLMNLSASQLEAVLAHELAHIRRHDYLVNLLQTIAETLFFYHPAVWWVSSRIRSERELCCDDLAVATCGDPVGYARALTQLERLRVMPPGLAVGSTSGPLMYRIRRLTGIAEPRSASGLPAAFALGLAIVGLTASLHLAQAQPQSAPQNEVSRNVIWVDTVKYGDFDVQVRALGTVTTPSQAELQVASSQVGQLQIGQAVSIELRRGRVIASGQVSQIGSAVGGSVPVSVQLQASAAEFVNQATDGVIQIKSLSNVVYVGCPAGLQNTGGKMTLFKVEPDGNSAKRVEVQFGAVSVSQAQILAGLKPGDKIILSDLASYDRFDRIRIN